MDKCEEDNQNENFDDVSDILEKEETKQYESYSSEKQFQSVLEKYNDE